VRDNGLQATSWVLLADLDPRVADAALEALRRAGVAAYTNPHPGIRRPYLDVTPNLVPTDRLYVDASARDRAKEVLVALDEAQPDAEAEHPGDGSKDLDSSAIDAEFARIIAGLDAPAQVEPAAPLVVPEESTPPELEEEHFVPPPPPPVPRGDALSRFAWLAVLGVPVIGLICVVVGWTLEGWQALALATAFVAGFVTLVVRMGNQDVDDDPEGGAVV
jgi:hypothetical protein